MGGVALLGWAHIHTPGFARMLKAHQDIAVTGVYDHDRERAAKAAAEFGVPIFESPEAALADSRTDAVVIASETDRHGDLVFAAAAAGKAMFVEKPLGFSADSALQMADAVEKAGVIFQTGYFSRGRGIFRFLRDELQAGAFGTVTRVRFANCHNGLYRGFFDQEWRWMADPAVAGCGAFGDLGTHALDILMWYFGIPESGTASLFTADGRFGSDCDEGGEALLRFPGNVTATLAASWLDGDVPCTFEIAGTRACASIIRNELYYWNPDRDLDGRTPYPALPADLPHAFELFCQAITGGNPPLVPVREAAMRSVVMEQLYTAARTGTIVKLG